MPTRVLNVLVVLAVLAAAGSVVQAVVLTDGPDYTETYLLTENESGELVADDYPTNVTEGEAAPLVLGVENGKDRAVNYTVVVQLQRVTRAGDSFEAVETQSIARFERRVAPDERALVRHDVEPALTGDRLRLVYLVYDGAPPADPTMENSDAEVRLWVTVQGQDSPSAERSCSQGCR